MLSHFSFFLVLLLVMTSFAFLNSAEARSADEPCSYLHKSWKINPNTGICGPSIIHKSSSAQNYATNNPTNTFQQISCGEGTILKGNSCVIDFRHEIAAQGQTDGINDAFLPVTNLFDNIPDNQWLTHEWNAFSAKVDPVLIGFFAAIFIASIFFGRQFSRKKRTSRRNRRFIKSSKWSITSDWLRRSIFPLHRDRYGQWSSNIPDEPGRLRVTPAEYSRMQAFEKSFATVGKSDPEYFLHVTSGAKLIDASRRGNELYSINTIIRGRSLRLLKYRDTSTKVQDPLTGKWIGQPYVCFVPEGYNKADHAMAWKFRLTPSEYRRTKGNEA
jgi:hypothetical protein